MVRGPRPEWEQRKYGCILNFMKLVNQKIGGFFPLQTHTQNNANDTACCGIKGCEVIQSMLA